MRTFKCEDCGETTRVNGLENLKHLLCICGGYKRPLMEKTEPVAEVPCSAGLSCEHLEEDSGCGEPVYACCIEWVNWKHRRFDQFAPAETFCKLSKKERDTYKVTGR